MLRVASRYASSTGKWGIITLATGMLVQALQFQDFMALSGTIEAGNRSSWRSRLKVMDLTAGGYFPVETQLLSHYAPKKTYVVRSNIDPEVSRLPEPMTLGDVLDNEQNAREGKK